MKDNFKILLSILVVVLILGVWLYIFYTDESSTAFEKLTGSENTAFNQSIDNPTTDQIKQYRMNYNYSGNQDLIIDLMQGESTFAMEYEGSGHFNVRLFDSRHNLIKQIADSTGPYRNLVTLQAPETGAYLLEVRAGDGPWRVEHR